MRTSPEHLSPGISAEPVPVYIYTVSSLLSGSLQHALRAEADISAMMTIEQAGFPVMPFVYIWDMDREYDIQEKIRVFRSDFPRARILVLGTFVHADMAYRILHAGADALVHKYHSYEALMAEIAWMASPEYEAVFRHVPVAGVPEFTLRELELMKWIAAGLTEQEIADRLFISILTVKSHKKNLFLKTQTRNVTSLVRFILENGFDRI